MGICGAEKRKNNFKLCCSKDWGVEMEIVVCIKQVPGTNKVDVDPVTGVLKRDGVDSKMNPYDLYAVETALRIKSEKGVRVNVISMGPPQAAEVIKEAFMMGADDGILLSDRKFAGADVLATAYTLSQGIKKLGGHELILCGKQTTDGDTAQVGPEMAEYLGIPHAANVRKIHEVGEESILVEIDLLDSVQVAEIRYPCLITVEKDIYQPRLPSFKRKLEIRNKAVRILALKDFEDQDESSYGLNGSPTKVERIFPPEVNNDREIWKDCSQELSQKLFTKLKELKYI